MLCSLKGIGDWSATSVLINFLHRADMIMYADLTTNHALTLALALTLIPTPTPTLTLTLTSTLTRYGDLTIRNYLNDLYDINHKDESETLLQSAADFADTTENRNLIDAVAEANQWRPYRSVVVYLMYHLQEDNLVLL